MRRAAEVRDREGHRGDLQNYFHWLLLEGDRWKFVLDCGHLVRESRGVGEPERLEANDLSDLESNELQKL
jgi:hypothetical protein